MFMRKDWELLDGEWDFAFDDSLEGRRKGWAESFPTGLKINVPFSYETELSGIGDTSHHPAVWYHRTVDLAPLDGSHRQILHIEGSDYETEVFVNGIYCGSHKGAYSRYSVDISGAVREGANDIVIAVSDSKDRSQPRGKQRWLDDSYGCWYVQTTGIWKSVWTERVSAVRIDGVKITPSITDSRIDFVFEIEGASDELTVEAVLSESASDYADRDGIESGSFGISGKRLTSVTVPASLKRTKASIHMDGEVHRGWGMHTWTPEDPYLYDLEFILRRGDEILDRVYSYVGFREYGIRNGNVLLNGVPLYQRLILDQGYWPKSGLTAPSEDALIEDIDKTLAMGYNGVRKHQKVEDERFLYWCDVKGLLVWSEFGAAYEFSDDAVQDFTEQWMEALRQNYNHPCIAAWTPFNESWGFRQIPVRKDQQAFADGIYHLTHAFDPQRPVIGNDGWEQTDTDIVTWHNYEESAELIFERFGARFDDVASGRLYVNGKKSAFADGHGYEGQPVMVTEFGGIAFATGSGWGYGSLMNSEEEFLKRFDDVTTAIKKLPFVTGYCYTQLTDVQQEVNGLLGADRNFKFDPEKIREINLRKVGMRDPYGTVV